MKIGPSKTVIVVKQLLYYGKQDVRMNTQRENYFLSLDFFFTLSQLSLDFSHTGSV